MTEQTPYRQQRVSANSAHLRIGCIILAAGLVAFNWLATQWAAAVMRYPEFLNGRIVGLMYQPFAWYWWQHRWPHNVVQIGHRMILLSRVWTICERLVLFPLLALAGVGALYALIVMQPQQKADLHGSATWATTQEVEKAGLL
jgi:type IV secretory pathway TraG/TraD family ATPase VirD4